MRGPLCAAVALTVVVSACSHTRGAVHRDPQPQPVSGESAPPPEPAAAPPESAQQADSNAEASSGASGRRADVDAAIPPCMPVESKSKPKTKPKPRTALRKQAAPPPQPQGPERPADAVVDAQVEPLPVPVMSILGKKVQSPDGDDLGRVVDVLADAGGRVRVAIIDFGGFLGVGDHRIAVDWPLLRFNPDRRDPSLLLSLSRDKLKAAPEYKDNPRPQTLMEPPPPGAATAQPAAPAASVTPAPSPDPKK